ncbi:MAG TPA: itaconate degradation C-C-lyase RipC [Caulobacteraceae bacterium]|nr:itaconate degradation C-C-lyase RipC [Caulobacteraceae bacterium]
MTAPILPTRSWLFTPGARPERFGKAAEVGADVQIIDLEDAVAPADKPMARAAALEFLSRSQKGRAARALRINGLDTAAGMADLTALLEAAVAPDYLVLPKTESPDHVRILDRLLTAAALDARIVGIVETARGLAQADAIAAASGRLYGLLFGAADMAADLGAEEAWEPLAYARGRIVAACARSGIVAIDTPFFDIRDTAGLEQETRRAAAMGFAAKAAIHPGQVAAINAAYTPSDAEVAKARQILVENAKGVGVVGGQMIDEAVARKARRILAAAGA